MRVILYHTEKCPVCKGVEAMLKKNHIEYEDNTNIEEMREKGINHPPVLEVDGEKYEGQKIVQFIRENSKA